MQRPATHTLQIGVIGVGGMGAFHAHVLAGLAGVDVVAVADPYAPNADRVSAELGCDALYDPIALATDRDLDGVVIASPDATHPDLAIAALEAGTWVLCEKPLATNLAEAQRVVDAEAALGQRRIQMGFMREYDPAHVQLVQAVGDVGRIHALHTVHRNCNVSPRPLALIVGQSMVHDFHSVHFLTGDRITDVHGFGAGASNDSFRHVVAMCSLSSGAHAIVEFDDGGFAYEVTVEVLGEHGDALTGRPLRAVRRRDGAVDTVIGPDWFAFFADAYRTQDAAWVASIRAGSAVGPSAWDALAAQAVVDATIESLRTGSTVAVPVVDRAPIY